MKDKNNIQPLEERITQIPGNPETPSELINKYGTYEIQPTGDADSPFPTIAQGLAHKHKKLSHKANEYMNQNNQ